MQRFGANSAQARAFIPAAELAKLAAAESRAVATQPRGSSTTRCAGGAAGGGVDPVLLAQLTEKVVKLQSADITTGARRKLLQITLTIPATHMLYR